MARWGYMHGVGLAAVVWLLWVTEVTSSNHTQSYFSRDLGFRDNGQVGSRPRRQSIAQRKRICGPATGPYSYDPAASNGPREWSRLSSCCGGEFQSPIALNRRASRCASTLGPYYIQSPYMNAKLYNDGLYLKVKPSTAASKASLIVTSTTGIPGDMLRWYTLDHVHVHFGNERAPGSEHTVDGKSFEAEIHMVHYVSSRGSVDNAMRYKDGLAVLAIPVSTSRGEVNAKLNSLLNVVSSLGGVGAQYAVPVYLNPKQLLPGRQDIFYYHGSLTTPSCSETVQFMVYDQPLRITKSQLEQLWRLPSKEPGVSIARHTNVRPLQPTNGRTVRTNFVC